MNKKNNNILIFLLLILIVSLSQFVLAAKHIKMGFLTDDWICLSLYRTFVTNPFLDIFTAWKHIGSHNFGPVYYLGILYNFLGLDYSAYRLINEILKIIATLTLYPLVFYVSKNRLLAFITTFIYAIHFSPFGLLDFPARGGDIFAIALMNLFLFAYFYIIKKGTLNIYFLFGLAVWLFTIILIGPTRLFPLLAIVLLIEIFNKISLKRLLILYSPLLFLFVFSPQSITPQLGYFSGVYTKLRAENWQILLTPFAALGSTYIPRNFWIFFNAPIYNNFSSYLSFFVSGPILIDCIFLISLGFFISDRPLKFIIRSITFNFISGMLVFAIAYNWLHLDKATRAPVDPGTFLVPALIGLFVVISSFCLFLEWKESKKKNNLLPFLFIGPIFSLTFITLTWFFADVNSIFMGVHAYLSIPSIGTSLVLATILVLIYQKICSLKIFQKNKIIPAALIIIIIGIFFRISFIITDEYFSNWLNNGVRITDQQRIWNQFWNELGSKKHYSANYMPLIYLGDSEEYENGAYYEEVITWRLANWFDLKYNQNKQPPFDLCEIEIRGKDELEKFVKISEDGKMIISNKCGDIVSHRIDDFFAFRLKDRNLVPNKTEVLNKLGITQ